MFGKFFYGQYSLSEAFWKWSVLGLFVLGGASRLFMILLKQTVNYDPNFIRVAINSLSFIQMNSTALVWFCFYVASFLASIAYSVICIGGMYNTYREYEKSKFLAAICMMIVWVIIYFAVSSAIY